MQDPLRSIKPGTQALIFLKWPSTSRRIRRKVKMKTLISIFTAVFLAASISIFNPPMADGASQYESARSASGIKATLVLTPDKGMIDLYLTDATTGSPIKSAKVNALISTPGDPAKKVEKKLIGMDMDGRFSYMNSLDMSFKGRYSFDIRIEDGKKRARFMFTHEKR